MINAKLRRWLPMALCCLPGGVAVAIVGFGLITGKAAFGASLGGPLGLGLVVLAMLACPLGMSLMMWRGMRRKAASGGSLSMAGCCMPDGAASTPAAPSAEWLVTLRDRREALEAEIAELQQGMKP